MLTCFPGMQRNATLRTWTHKKRCKLGHSPAHIWFCGCSLQNNWSVKGFHSSKSESQKAPSITTIALSASINPNPLLSRQGVVYYPSQLQLQASLTLSLSLPPLHSPVPTYNGITVKASSTYFCCCLNRLLVPPGTQRLTWAGFGHKTSNPSG